MHRSTLSLFFRNRKKDAVEDEDFVISNPAEWGDKAATSNGSSPNSSSSKLVPDVVEGVAVIEEPEAGHDVTIQRDSLI